jgi:two-component system, response regulator
MSQPLRLLIIEDNPDHVFLARREFQKAGVPIEIQHAADSQAALDYLRETPQLPDGILLDIKLPGRDGFELLILLKADERTRPIPVILLSSSPSPSDIERATRLGAASYFTKPVNAPDVLAILSKN